MDKKKNGPPGDAGDGQSWGLVGMTLDEAAAALRVERRTVVSAIRSKGLPARKVGRSWRISPAALDAWIAEGKFEPKGDDGEPGQDS